MDDEDHMSANPLTKMEIDILVQLALHGPIEASQWEALMEDADELGTRLWTLNLEYTGDTGVPVSSYKFDAGRIETQCQRWPRKPPRQHRSSRG